jgi:DNA-binding transcriptional MerR regulator
MAKLVNNELYLSPLEASAILQISYKTLQRWAETGTMNTWVGSHGSRRRKVQRVKIQYIKTPTGYRYYQRDSIESLLKRVASIV